jgi:hypothetical protein
MEEVIRKNVAKGEDVVSNLRVWNLVEYED